MEIIKEKINLLQFKKTFIIPLKTKIWIEPKFRHCFCTQIQKLLQTKGYCLILKLYRENSIQIHITCNYQEKYPPNWFEERGKPVPGCFEQMTDFPI